MIFFEAWVGILGSATTLDSGDSGGGEGDLAARGLLRSVVRTGKTRFSGGYLGLI